MNKYIINYFYIIYNMSSNYDKLLKNIFKYLDKHKKTIDETFKLMIIDLLTETNIDYNIFKKILKGAYVIIIDNGYFYNRWIKYHKKNLKECNKTVEPLFIGSSHYSCDKQYRLGNGVIYDTYGNFTNTFDFLLGTNCLHSKCKKLGKSKSKSNNSCHTWFQLEKSRLSTLISYLEHFIDYVNYYIKGKNIGPFGESEHTETNNPIIIKLKKAYR